MAKLVWTEEAFAALEEIYAYIAKDNAKAAFATVDGIYKKTQMLQEHPRLGYPHRKRGGVEDRILLYGHYRILYEIDGDRVGVTGVYHAARDIEYDV